MIFGKANNFAGLKDKIVKETFLHNFHLAVAFASQAVVKFLIENKCDVIGYKTAMVETQYIA